MSFSVLDVSDHTLKLSLNTTHSAKAIAATLAIDERAVQQAGRGTQAVKDIWDKLCQWCTPMMSSNIFHYSLECVVETCL